MSRPLFSWAKNSDLDNFTVRHGVVYGDDPLHGPVNPIQTNHLGQPYKNYDESGLDTILEYDFKGNVISAQKQVIKDSLLLTSINDGATPTRNIRAVAGGSGEEFGAKVKISKK